MRLGHTGMTPTDLIHRINEKHRALLPIPMHTFCMATHPRVGSSSAVYRVFSSSPLYDPHLLRLICQFACPIFIPLPTLEEAEKMKIPAIQLQAANHDWKVEPMDQQMEEEEENSEEEKWSAYWDDDETSDWLYDDLQLPSIFM